jgi:hypothetical protein
MLRLMRAGLLVLVAALSAVGCSKGSQAVKSTPSAGTASASPAALEFDRKWAELAQQEVEAFYVEDDRVDGEKLMGSVRRAKRAQTLALLSSSSSSDFSGSSASHAASPSLAPSARPSNPLDPAPPPEMLSGEDVQQVIRQNLPGVRACFLRLSREGEQRSGKAIVSFRVGAEGQVQEAKVDAPTFDGTSLAKCVSGQVSHWSFPRSQKGGLAISYPFVFVGG